MNRYSEVAQRYAKALYSAAKESGNENLVFDEIRELEKVFSNEEVFDFLSSPLVNAEGKEVAVKKALENAKASESVKSIVDLLAKKNRLPVFSEVVKAYEDQADENNGVTRGTVRSPSVLSPEERQQIEEIVKKATGKNVILTYQEDANLIGGLVAEVGSYTFDDSIDSHLRRMKEELNRSTH